MKDAFCPYCFDGLVYYSKDEDVFMCCKCKKQVRIKCL